jgi:NTP pyrophosphatase (non-canonical NTP hydrolase)
MSNSTQSALLPIPKGLEFPEPMNLAALQEHCARVCHHFGWDNHTHEKAFLLMMEEIGELAKAMRKVMGYAIEQDNPYKPVQDQSAVRANIEEEFADVLNYFIELANRFDIDLEKVYRNKMTQNFQRSWS